ncbi:unnamed protein product [Acanthoscelides obtectus]|uniref:Uncharacterized protein n=1 Tax=Acanthoscelides obtectus TaxID=200917 RepID=A0A9P0MFL2_ACAOB|nr:unnamed protein product [Acanthoscelides obtectus]CAK1626628.1 hypothetical protein AOBTE_LOCUS3991 [Acanthoscelides obtectus]
MSRTVVVFYIFLIYTTGAFSRNLDRSYYYDIGTKPLGGVEPTSQTDVLFVYDPVDLNQITFPGDRVTRMPSRKHVPESKRKVGDKTVCMGSVTLMALCY